jgi:hypothetical protein
LSGKSYDAPCSGSLGGAKSTTDPQQEATPLGLAKSAVRLKHGFESQTAQQVSVAEFADQQVTVTTSSAVLIDGGPVSLRQERADDVSCGVE